MFRKNERHRHDDMFSSAMQLPAKRRRMPERSWAEAFYRDFFCRIDEQIFRCLYSEKWSRPNAPVNQLGAFEVIRAGRGWSDEEAYEALCFDMQVRRSWPSGPLMRFASRFQACSQARSGPAGGPPPSRRCRYAANIAASVGLRRPDRRDLRESAGMPAGGVCPRPRRLPQSPASEMIMARTIEIPMDLAHFELPDAVEARLQSLLDRQEAGGALSPEERREAQGLVDLAEFLSLLRQRTLRAGTGS